MRNLPAVLTVLMSCLTALLFVAATPTLLHAEGGSGGGGNSPPASCQENLTKAIAGLKLCRAELTSCESRTCPVPNSGDGQGGGLTHRNAMKALLESPEKLDVDDATKLSLLSAAVLDSRARILPKEKLLGVSKALGQARDALKQVDAAVAKRKTESAP